MTQMQKLPMYHHGQRERVNDFCILLLLFDKFHISEISCKNAIENNAQGKKNTNYTTIHNNTKHTRTSVYLPILHFHRVVICL